MANKNTVVTTGSTYENANNLADTFITKMRDEVEGSRLGRQEIFAEVLNEAAGALWSREILAKCEVDIPDKVEFAHTLNRVIVSVDPAVTANAESDMTGIVVAGIDVNGTCFVLEDATDKFTPEGWASKAVELYTKYSADRIVAERNQGGEMVRHTLKTIARAEPVSSLYEREKVKHAKGLDDLEDQMVQWEPLGSIGSPDRLDALVWAITDLALKGVAYSTLTMEYGDSKSILKSNLSF
jgi:phage terminase large subunit-like protein